MCSWCPVSRTAIFGPTTVDEHVFIFDLANGRGFETGGICLPDFLYLKPCHAQSECQVLLLPSCSDQVQRQRTAGIPSNHRRVRRYLPALLGRMPLFHPTFLGRLCSNYKRWKVHSDGLPFAIIPLRPPPPDCWDIDNMFSSCSSINYLCNVRGKENIAHPLGF